MFPSELVWEGPLILILSTFSTKVVWVRIVNFYWCFRRTKGDFLHDKFSTDDLRWRLAGALFWQLVNTANVLLFSLPSILFVSTGELTHPALSTNCKSGPTLRLVKRKWHLWQLSSAESVWKWDYQRSWPEAFFIPGLVLQSALRVACIWRGGGREGERIRKKRGIVRGGESDTCISLFVLIEFIFQWMPPSDFVK